MRPSVFFVSRFVSSLLNESGAVPYNLRTVDEITSFFDGLELLDPGVVSVPLWRPDATDPAPEVVAEHGGLARKR